MVVRKFLKVLTVSAALSSTALFAADPGGTVGLAKATFTGSSFDTTSSVMANAAGYVLVPEEMYASSLPAKTTVAWAGYMRMDAGVTYDFKGCYDDYVSVKINGAWVLSQGGECKERTGSYVPTATDWYPIEFRVANNNGGGGCQNASQYGILWRKNSDVDWRQVSPYDEQGLVLFKTGRNDLMSAFKTTPIVLSSKMRENAPTVMDVTYIVCSPHDTVNVRALAFEDGERSFWKVVRPETFVNDPDDNPTAQNIGDNIPANVVHKLAWKVDSDWKTDLAKVRFEVVVSDQAILPIKLHTIPAAGKYPAVTVAYNQQEDEDILNAIYWCYADKSPDFVNNNGYLDMTNGTRWVNRTTLNASERWNMLKYFYLKEGYVPLYSGSLLAFVRNATRKDLWNNSSVQNVWVKKGSVPQSLYVEDKGYCVVDVSAGASASSYPVTYVDDEPISGWPEEYKRTKIVFRKIHAGRFMFLNVKDVTLTKDYYMAVYPITQSQYELVVGSNPSSNKGADCPVQVSWSTARGSGNWPTNKQTSPTSFLGKLSARTGMRFDLPTEAQWEYACRAGTSSSYNNGGSSKSDDMSLLGIMSSKGSVPYSVGMYNANLWGLYDMHGNITEFCLDWVASVDSDPAVDPEGPSTGDNRIGRGGGFLGGAGWDSSATSFSRSGTSPYLSTYNSYTSGAIWAYYGIRPVAIIE